MFVCKINAQCPAGSVTIGTQAQLNQFQTNYPNCTKITGNLTIESQTITNVNALSKIEEITGYVRIWNNPLLTQIDGLAKLKRIGFYFGIYNNPSLTNLNGLSALETVANYINVDNNDAVTSLNGLSKLTSIGGSIRVANNALLVDISDIKNVNSTTISDLVILNNAKLEACNLPNLCSFLSNPANTHPRNITGNKANCLNESAVIDACTPPPVVYIPDTKFKSHLINNPLINTNSDQEIQVSEAEAFTGEIDCQYKGVLDLTGIEAFKNIVGLYCNNNYISSLDVSKNKLLIKLICFSNNIQTLDLRQNTKLEKIDCGINNLTSLNVDGCTEAKLLLCSSNNLETVNLSTNLKLEYIHAIYNNFSSIDVSFLKNLIELRCEDNSLTSLDLHTNNNLTTLLCQNNNLTTLNIKNDNNSAITTMTADNNPDLKCIQVDDASKASTYSGWTKDATTNYNTDCSQMLGIDTSGKVAVAIYPNPVKSVLNFSEEVSNITITDLTGRTLKQIPTSAKSVNVATLEKGNYIITGTTKSGNAITKKLIKE